MVVYRPLNEYLYLCKYISPIITIAIYFNIIIKYNAPWWTCVISIGLTDNSIDCDFYNNFAAVVLFTVQKQTKMITVKNKPVDLILLIGQNTKVRRKWQIFHVMEQNLSLNTIQYHITLLYRHFCSELRCSQPGPHLKGLPSEGQTCFRSDFTSSYKCNKSPNPSTVFIFTLTPQSERQTLKQRIKSYLKPCVLITRTLKHSFLFIWRSLWNTS